MVFLPQIPSAGFKEVAFFSETDFDQNNNWTSAIFQVLPCRHFCIKIINLLVIYYILGNNISV